MIIVIFLLTVGLSFACAIPFFRKHPIKDIILPMHKDITYTEILSVDENPSSSSALGRAIVGDFLFGTLGAIGGVMTAKHKKYTTFEVNYIDGRKISYRVLNNSYSYLILNKYLR